ncbi:hypothetical protein LPTSP1_36580 [Leptospira johnsonii]|uniref:Uncharacterized protein n=1 Tax=Leptospira johnsonii TaxID=1917820 RepID=A0A2P2D7N8_9LEPT|nr:hypothetical protein LPTSP1_36580 [Leptospira johnsonii]
MSETYGFGCEDCEEYIWTSQGSYDRTDTVNFYKSDDRCMEKFKEFIRKHYGHSITFRETPYFDGLKYKEDVYY